MKGNHAGGRRRRLGQHFLARHASVQRVIAAIDPQPGQRFLEVGPGRGALTFPLLTAGVRVLAVEVDARLARHLAARVAPGAALSLVEGDILKVDLAALVHGQFLQGPGVRVAGNLPYSVASPALLRLLARPDLFADWTLMVQKEVADRILASPGSRLYGVLSLLSAARADGARLLDLPPSSFSPPPAVHSTLLHFTPRPAPFASHEAQDDFEKVVKAAFSSRRKMLRNALSAGLRIEPAQAEAVLRAGGINPEDRPERIPLQGYVELTARVRERISLI